MLADQTTQVVDDDSFLDWETRHESIPFHSHIIAGSCAGIMEHVGMYPLDTIKTHLQASGRNLTFMRTAKILYKEEGFLRFWKGAQVIASGCIPAHASYFTAYELLKKYFNYNNEKYEFLQTATIGALTTFVHDFFITPSDMIKQRMQLCSHLTTSQCIRQIVKDEGFIALYRSYPVTVTMNIPFATTVVCVNENLKTYVQPWNKQNPYFWYFLCAGTAGGLAGLVTNPLDVIKTRLQTQEIKPSCQKLRDLWDATVENTRKDDTRSLDDINKNKADKIAQECGFEVKKVRYRDFFSTLSVIYQREGIKAFTKGVGPRMCINVPSTALSWGTYELIKSFIAGRDAIGGAKE